MEDLVERLVPDLHGSGDLGQGQRDVLAVDRQVPGSNSASVADRMTARFSAMRAGSSPVPLRKGPATRIISG